MLKDAEHSAARFREKLVGREQREVMSFLASSKCALFSEVEGAVSANECDINMLLAAGGGRKRSIGHVRLYTVLLFFRHSPKNN